MTAAVLMFPCNSVRRPEADAVRLSYDFNQWCAELYRGERFLRRTYFNALDGARAEVERIAANGLRRLPDAKPDWTAVAYGELSDGECLDGPEEEDERPNDGSDYNFDLSACDPCDFEIFDDGGDAA